MMGYQKPEAFEQTNDSLQGTLCGWAYWTKVDLWHTTAPNATRMNKNILERWKREVGLVILFVLFRFVFN